MNPIFGVTMLRFDLSRKNASYSRILMLRIRKAKTIVDDRETPDRQCTKTFSLFSRASDMKSLASSKNISMGSRDISSTSTRKYSTPSISSDGGNSLGIQQQTTREILKLLSLAASRATAIPERNRPGRMQLTSSIDEDDDAINAYAKLVLR